MSVEDAVLGWSQKQILKDNPKPKKRNKSPEQYVEKQCMTWFKFKGFSMNVVEAKGVWNNQARRYLKGNTVSGFSDSAGCTPNGYGCFVEFKAKDRVATLKHHQRSFLIEKIERGCFACVVDDVERLQKHFQIWDLFISDGERAQAKAFLMSILPKQTTKKITSNDFDL